MPGDLRVYQYSAKAARLRGCSECKGEPDDVCLVRPGLQSRSLEEYQADRFPAPGRVKLLRSRAEPDCAIALAALLGPKAPLELAAIRLARAPPSAQLLARAGQGAPGWPLAPAHRTVQPAAPRRATPPRDNLRLALVCWGSATGWPQEPLGARSSCELWLLGVTAEGEPDPAAPSVQVLPPKGPEKFAYGDARLAAAFAAAPLDEQLLFGPAKAARAAGQGAAAPQAAAPPAQEGTSAAQPGGPGPAHANGATQPGGPGPAQANGAAGASGPGGSGAATNSAAAGEARARSGSAATDPRGVAAQAAPELARCGEAAQRKAATVDRFDQWDAQITGRRSLDRAKWTLDAGLWSGHCQELDVLRAALEQQLGCAVQQEGKCL